MFGMNYVFYKCLLAPLNLTMMNILICVDCHSYNELYLVVVYYSFIVLSNFICLYFSWDFCLNIHK